ncbi:putative acetyltransferase [Tritonibacter multivorans]|uniref:Putative acetyltransferase n=1 Tax=Tritonibacter multivorans TaxID=928856 RepID=A0A0P1GVV2_9RHOB|nr:GNAT family protein [Tritonibacter multivorans]MDA7419291.1 GNAT family protein [Tritonibacter multivorans]CUH79130.1 putative acetyltransferase [Tritonibacter multivorans]SFD23397.1 Protein N-acetyltransferase, RimJ/RimL family [Tritonibacter multivorans]
MTCLRFRPLVQDDYALMRHITVAPEQVIYSGTVKMAFDSEERGVDLHGVFEDRTGTEQPVGFFKIDHKYPQTYNFARTGDLGLRAFMIDQPCQGRGLGSAAVARLGPYLRRLYPAAEAMVLTVNLRNTAAIRAYLKAGMQDTGDLYTGGIAGPQHVMRLTLPNSPMAVDPGAYDQRNAPAPRD